MTKYSVADLKPGQIVTLKDDFASKVKITQIPDSEGDVFCYILSLGDNSGTYAVGDDYVLFGGPDEQDSEKIVHVETPGEAPPPVRRVILSNGTTTLPEATLNHYRTGMWNVTFDGNSEAGVFYADGGWTARTIETLHEFPTKPWSVIQIAGYLPMVLDDLGNWRDPFGNKLDLDYYPGDWVELVPKEVQ